MNPVTKNDLQVALQQVTNSILAKTISAQDANNMMMNSAQRLCTKQDVAAAINGARDGLMERLGAQAREQQAFMRTVLTQLETMQRYMTQLEAKLDATQAALREARMNAVRSNERQSQQQPNEQPQAAPAPARPNTASSDGVFYDYFG